MIKIFLLVVSAIDAVRMGGIWPQLLGSQAGINDREMF
jgi:hypothetical protein